MEIILEKIFRKQTKCDNVITMSRNANQLIELGMASLATASLQNDECALSNYPDTARSSKWRSSMLAKRNVLEKTRLLKDR